MERLALQKLIAWNIKPNRKPLIIWGARQVGKTYLCLLYTSPSPRDRG